MFYCDLSTPSYPQPTNVSNSKLYLHSGVISSLAICCPGHYHHWPYVQTVYFRTQKCISNASVFAKAWSYWTGTLSTFCQTTGASPCPYILPNHLPWLWTKKRKNMQFQMYRWLTLKCQCSAKFRGCYRINGNVKVSKTRYAWWWSPRKNLIHIVFTNEPNQPTILIYFCSLKRGSSFRRNLFSVISYYHVAMRWDHRIIPRCVRLWWWWW